MNLIYLDNAATTQVAPEVADAVIRAMREDFGNPSSAHRLGIAASNRIKAARALLLDALGDERGRLGDLVWTSGGTEADALGVLGAARALSGRGRHVVVTAIEHPAVLGSAQKLVEEGFDATVVPVTRDGVASANAVADAVTDETVLVAAMLVNNELGTIQPIAEISAAVKAKRPDIQLHCDAVQGFGKLVVDVRTLGVDTLAISGHKIAGPKGIGALWIRRGARIAPLWQGGGQQQGLRSGTENVPGIVGLACATELSLSDRPAKTARLTALQVRFEQALGQSDLGISIHGAGAPRVAHITSLALPGLPAEPLLHALEARGVYVSAGSACASKNHGPSHVLAAIGVPVDVGTLRVSLSTQTTAAELDEAARLLVAEARTLRVS